MQQSGFSNELKLLITWVLRERKNEKQKGNEKVKGKGWPFRGESLIKRFAETEQTGAYFTEKGRWKDRLTTDEGKKTKRSW